MSLDKRKFVKAAALSAMALGAAAKAETTPSPIVKIGPDSIKCALATIDGQYPNRFACDGIPTDADYVQLESRRNGENFMESTIGVSNCYDGNNGYVGDLPPINTNKWVEPPAGSAVCVAQMEEQTDELFLHTGVLVSPDNTKTPCPQTHVETTIYNGRDVDANVHVCSPDGYARVVAINGDNSPATGEFLVDCGDGNGLQEVTTKEGNPFENLCNGNLSFDVLRPVIPNNAGLTVAWESVPNGSETPTDADEDGVPDGNDQCPGTPTGEAVDGNGCSDSQKDSDSDGVSDAIDQCPNTPADKEVDANGCEIIEEPSDSDSDGVPDGNDQCPGTPTGEAVDGNGCSDSQKDSDSDGVSDAIDQCPNTPADKEVDANGCEIIEEPSDSDSDGVPDGNDQCPGTPTGEAVDGNGCSDSQKDSDSDGVSDAIDQCPNTPADKEVDANGCEIIEEPEGSEKNFNETMKCGQEEKIPFSVGDGGPQTVQLTTEEVFGKVDAALTKEDTCKGWRGREYPCNKTIEDFGRIVSHKEYPISVLEKGDYHFTFTNPEGCYWWRNNTAAKVSGTLTSDGDAFQ